MLILVINERRWSWVSGVRAAAVQGGVGAGSGFMEMGLNWGCGIRSFSCRDLMFV